MVDSPRFTLLHNAAEIPKHFAGKLSLNKAGICPALTRASMNMNMKKAFKPLTAIVTLVLVGGLLTACHHQHRGHGDPEKMVERLEGHLEHVLDKVDATPQQRDQILLISTQIAEDVKQLHRNGAGKHGEILANLLSDTPDKQQLHSLVDQKTIEMNEFTHRTLDRLIEISAVLTPEQRLDLKTRFESAHGKKS